MSSSRAPLRAMRLTASRPSTICSSCRTRILSHLRWNSSTTSSSPIISRLRPDLKAAMQSKDTPRLSVLRAILAAITNASKTAKPVDSDIALLALFKKHLSASQASKAEFEAAGRKDLADKEDAQIQVLKEYAGKVDVLSADEIQAIVKDVVTKLKKDGGKADMGSVMKSVKESLAGKNVDMGEVSKAVKTAIS